jgi:hypothetical protein
MDIGLRWVASLEKRLVGEGPLWRLADAHCCGGAREVTTAGFQRVIEVVGENNRFGAGICNNVAEFLPMQPGVNRHRDQAGLEDSE